MLVMVLGCDQQQTESKAKYFTCSGVAGIYGTIESPETATVVRSGDQMDIEIGELKHLSGSFFTCLEDATIIHLANSPMVKDFKKTNPEIYSQGCFASGGRRVGIFNKVSGELTLTVGVPMAIGSLYSKQTCKETKPALQRNR
ncbi:MAG: hypothetical protein EXR32_07250 [Betaproteobacteria bacterium]|nr:hypothetical protein [Betaproteobacteria bacterium]